MLHGLESVYECRKDSPCFAATLRTGVPANFVLQPLVVTCQREDPNTSAQNSAVPSPAAHEGGKVLPLMLHNLAQLALLGIVARQDLQRGIGAQDELTGE